MRERPRRVKSYPFSLTVLFGGVVLLSGCLLFSGKNREVGKAYYDLGSAYLESKDYEESVRFLLKAIEWDPSLTRKAGYNLAWAYAYTRKIEEARNIIEDMLPLSPENVLLLELKGYLHALEGEWDDALAAYQQIVDLSDYDDKALFNSGLMEAKRGNLEEAGHFWEEAYLIKRDSATAIQLARLYRDQDEKKKAVTYYKAYLKQKPRDKEALEELLTLHEEEKEYGHLLEAIDSFLFQRDKGDDLDILFKKAVVLLTLVNEFKEGLTVFEQVIEEGFHDETAIRDLLDQTNPSIKQRIEALLKRYAPLSPTSDDEKEDPDEIASEEEGDAEAIRSAEKE